MINFISIFVVLLSFHAVYVAPADVKDTPHYDVVNEYIRSLGAIHRIQQIATQEFKEDDEKDTAITRLMSAIRNSTRIKLELNASIAGARQQKQKLLN